MSRTYRRKRDPIPYWIFIEYDTNWNKTFVDRKSEDGKRLKAKYLSDAGTFKHKEPGPSWFRNLYTERPQRREAKRQLKIFMTQDDYEVILNAKDKLEYWT